VDVGRSLKTDVTSLLDAGKGTPGWRTPAYIQVVLDPDGFAKCMAAAKERTVLVFVQNFSAPFAIGMHAVAGIEAQPWCNTIAHRSGVHCLLPVQP
jgi:hypothetical protein